jgi:aminoglycoside phosphotransferase (APT) family kinase protein
MVNTHLTPNPMPAAEHVLIEYAEDFTGWRRLAKESGERPAEFAWAWHNLDRLASLEAAWPDAAAGDTLLHGDLRADNMLITRDGLMLVDWPSAVVGPPWLDLLFMMPSAIMHGVDDPERVWRDYPPAQDAEPEAVDAVLAAVAGFFVWGSLQPPPQNLPRLRAFQAAQGHAALTWLQRR